MAILVVDDSKAMRMIVRRELRKAGYDNVVEAENGAAALQTITGGGVELVLSDWNMPEMNGIELLNSVRDAGNRVAFGFVTSEAAVEIRLQAFEAGASFVIIKPFTSDDLAHQITLALGTGGQDDAKVAGGSEQTVAEVLEGLLGRKVLTGDAAAPRKEVARAVATYDIAGAEHHAYFVAEIPVAASLACALTRIPAGRAEEAAKAGSLAEGLDSNFYEVANVLAKMASSEHCVLRAVEVVPGGKQLPGGDAPAGWHISLDVDVEGYPKGRLGFVTI
ncbi:response regulator [Acidiferrimicrobium sp. IK]|uniref:response regulator n=1 Tax=Acidiferrimicrobium sp. IK TaxID=2871700 RepID=UPI0021CB2DAC|nr:response regulator [Acidiferrimicrobium sp. IK]MCU4185659.1 response regulator [Acidiferrimicrobium sp. IK]